jgi:hypothetical protein
MSDTKKGKGKYVRPIEVLAQVVATGRLYWADAEVTRFYKEPSPGFWANYPGGSANFWETDEGKLWRYKKDFDVWPIEVRTIEFGWLSVPVLSTTEDGFMVKAQAARLRSGIPSSTWTGDTRTLDLSTASAGRSEGSLVSTAQRRSSILLTLTHSSCLPSPT